VVGFESQSSASKPPRLVALAPKLFALLDQLVFIFQHVSQSICFNLPLFVFLAHPLDFGEAASVMLASAAPIASRKSVAATSLKTRFDNFDDVRIRHSFPPL